MQRSSNRAGGLRFAGDEAGGLDDGDDYGYLNFTYRPLSRLPTPPPTLNKDSSLDDQSLLHLELLGDGESLSPKFRGPAIHLVNLIPSAASFANASVPFVQAMLARAELPIETVALAVCILDSLDSKFGRNRFALFLHQAALPPLTPHRTAHRQIHIDSVRPEIIILAALVIAAKFTQDLQEPPQFYRIAWGRSMWSNEQLNVTERCIMESLDYRIMPLCDEDCLTDAMVDMQLAGRLDQTGCSRWDVPREPTPPDSLAGSECEFVPGHHRSKTTYA
ncbi:hypothetical protein PT974_00754 [Cladobotryum mycophilum]|uniref:Cyclin N-terminal domain-containing protein n=1 Tax=Cladobotryum mycophilum TaxID=491253 RepID=A0ABR0T302_9HYPO